ncbi:hypothetical protein E1301_Tti019089 [Triplophysa tibetana]|uniref:SET domain-containing protein n=1 Tax=Triplophysa tibetana TaxID=1572043 RepID=A0A5A9NTV8_9TELE|nr:hypothetical protein E1301_Tti019089 [Triplophysa tibetana]
MASQSTNVHNRHFLACPTCKKTQATLSVHLRRVCMKNATPEAIAKVVEKAKADSLEILQTGRVFSYGQLAKIMLDPSPIDSLIEELEHRHMVVTDIPLARARAPMPSTNTTPQPGTVVTTPESPAVAETEETEPSEVGSDSSGETFQIEPNMQWKNQARKLMAEKGLYQKHSLDHPLLKEFAMYLEKDLQNENFKQEVENVSRFLHFMDPKQPSLLFVRNREKSKLFLRELTEAKLTKQTQLNYLKSLKRFLQYHTVNTDLIHSDEQLHKDCKHFIEYIGSLQKGCSKLVSKEIVQKRHDVLTQPGQLTPRDCWTVLDKAKRDFLAVIAKVFPERGFEETLAMSECTLVLYYLEAVVILKHLQRPGVVEHMTVDEWKSRTANPSGDGAVIGVKEHKTSAQQVATFVLSGEEESWFGAYYDEIRPELLSGKTRKRTWDGAESLDRFFISSTGRPIYNASNDINRLHEKYGVKPVTSQMARKVFETAAKSLDDSERGFVADYLTHSTATADKHYRMKTPKNAVLARKLLGQLAGESGSEPEEQAGKAPSPLSSGSEAESTHAVEEKVDVQKAYDTLLLTHPVTLDGEVPDRSVRSAASVTFQRQLYERWIKAQMRLRLQSVISHFGRRLPKENHFISWTASQGWKSNTPSYARIVSDWKAPGPVRAVMDCTHIRKLTTSQKWKGLTLTDKDVVTKRSFQIGEVICDYHGRLVTASEARNIKTSNGESGALFFYRNRKGESMCIDSSRCECHPDAQPFCHRICHSGKHANLRPRLFTVQEDGRDKDIILFLAIRKIQTNEALCYDYGDKKKSYRGEGLDLNWE